eukprot:GFUD01081198.1.p1 GENE.GFUD01081198.1~~GFUD01081198.1.p1  ORF type:complete len:118 (-),score=28.11 GFUD01081198.1:61-414(-)
MTMWADNIKFVKDIIDSQYHKIDHAVAEIKETSEALLKNAKCRKSSERFIVALRSLELVQPSDIKQHLGTITSDLHEKEKEALETEAKTKLTNRTEALEKARKLSVKLNLPEFLLYL